MVNSLLLVPFGTNRLSGEDGSFNSFETGRSLGEIDTESDREAKNLFLRTSAEGGSSEDLDFWGRL